MRQTIVNLALLVVRETVDTVLAAEAVSQPRQTASIVDLKDRLVTFVLSRMPARYVTLDETTLGDLSHSANCYSQDQHQQIRQLIHQGLEKLSNSPVQQASLVTTSPEVCEPSNWFG